MLFDPKISQSYNLNDKLRKNILWNSDSPYMNQSTKNYGYVTLAVKGVKAAQWFDRLQKVGRQKIYSYVIFMNMHF